MDKLPTSIPVFSAYDCTFEDDETWQLRVEAGNDGKFEFEMCGIVNTDSILLTRADTQKLVMFLTEQINDFAK